MIVDHREAMFIIFESIENSMSLTVSLDSSMSRDVETLAARNGLSVSEYVTQLIAEAIEDARDYERCAELIADYEKNGGAVPLDHAMRRYGLL